MYPNPNFLIDEVARVVVKLPADATWYGMETFVPIVVDSIQPHHKLLLDCSRGMEYLPAYRLFERLCEDRAERALMGHLRIDGLVVQPERYLALWRKAIAEAVTPHELGARFGLRLVVHLRGNICALTGRTTSWSNGSFRDMEPFCRKYQDQLTVYDRGDFSLDLDLRDEDAARDAFGISCLLPLTESGYLAPPNRIFVDLEHLALPLRRLLQAGVPGERLQRV